MSIRCKLVVNYGLGEIFIMRFLRFIRVDFRSFKVNGRVGPSINILYNGLIFVMSISISFLIPYYYEKFFDWCPVCFAYGFWCALL